MKVSDYTKIEVNTFRELCNFTGDELTVFELLAHGMLRKQIQTRTPYGESTVCELCRKVESKVARVAKHEGFVTEK